MADGIACCVVGKLAEYFVHPVLVQIKYLFNYSSNIQNLQNKVQELENKRNDVKQLVVAAERNTEIVREEVLAWLLKVDDLKENTNGVLNGIAGSEMGCLFNICPNLTSRYVLSRRAKQLTSEADNLKMECTFEKVSDPRSLEQVFNLTSHKVFETRLSTKRKIKEALKDKDISIIGICGMPGVGKTIMAKEIVNEVKDEKLFEEVAFAVVSNDPDINEIQDQLAEMLGLKIEENTNVMRARRLRQRLEVKDGKSILVVLDDVWKDIDLGTIGIPSPHDRKGLKIMFTTQTEEMCSQMEAQRKFEITVLDKKVGWQLFKDTAGISDDETDVELVSIAKKVADECGCLPLALEVVGKALKNKGIRKWRDALQQLLKSKVTNLDGHISMYSKIELSYKELESDEDRDLLLLCSLFAEDESIPIEILVRYARGLELFPNTDTLNETRDRAYSIALNLKSCNLLQQGEGEDEVKLHDVIRDFCLRKAYEDKRGYLVKHAGLIEWPELESYIAISITFDELGQLPRGLKYENIKLLRLICRKYGECIISEEFFKDMKDLRVLELKGMYIQIPSSIQLLAGLQTLCLIRCKIHSQLSMIGSLKKLEILSFYRSFGDYSPIEFTNFCKIRSLDLRFRELSCPLRPGVLSGLKTLEELCLGRYIPREGEDAKILKNVVSELDGDGFINLKTLILASGDFEYLIDATNSIPNGTFGKLGSLKLNNLPKLIEICNGNLPRGVIKPQLFCNLVSVEMKSCGTIRSLFRDSVANNLVNLQRLFISSCPMLEEVVSTDARENEVNETCKMLEFPKLKEVILGNLPRFKSITSQSNSDVVPQTLFNQKLVRIEMKSCGTIRSLFRESVANSLVNLQRLFILDCPMMEEVISTDARENEVTKTCKMLEFPKLKEVKLWFLPRFKSITFQSNSDAVPQTWFNQVTFPNMEMLTVRDLHCIVKLLGKEMPITSLHKLKGMDVWHCDKLLTIAESDSIQLLQNLGYLSVRRCDALEVLFDFEGIKVTNDDAEINMLGQLKSLSLHVLPELVHITRMVPKGIPVFQNLTHLYVIGCKSLRYLLSPSIVNSLVALEYLTIWSCKALEEIIGREEDEKEENTSEKRNIVMDANTPSNFTQVVSMDAKQNEVIDMPEFPKLYNIWLYDLSSFKSFRSETNNDGILQKLFNQVTSKSLQNLERLEVVECKALEVLLDFECLTIPEDHAKSVLGRLRELKLISLDNLVHIIGTVPKGIRVFENLTSIVVERCGILKYLFSPSMANSLVALNVLKVSDCGSIEEIIGKEEEGTSEIKEEEEEEMKNTIVFPNLNCLLLKDLSSIQMFCSQNYELEFPLLKDLHIENCPKMKKLSPWPVSAPKLNISNLLGKAGGF